MISQQELSLSLHSAGISVCVSCPFSAYLYEKSLSLFYYMLSPLNCCGDPHLDWLQFDNMSLLLGDPKLHIFPDVVLQVQNRADKSVSFIYWTLSDASK